MPLAETAAGFSAVNLPANDAFADIDATGGRNRILSASPLLQPQGTVYRLIAW
jgi:hypothetical protein